MADARYKLVVECIRCHKSWEKETTIAQGTNEVSGSLCKSCFREVISPTIRNRQLREGNFDCFGKAGTYCDQPNCQYRSWCLFMEDGDNGETDW